MRALDSTKPHVCKRMWLRCCRKAKPRIFSAGRPPHRYHCGDLTDCIETSRSGQPKAYRCYPTNSSNETQREEREQRAGRTEAHYVSLAQVRNCTDRLACGDFSVHDVIRRRYMRRLNQYTKRKTIRLFWLSCKNHNYNQSRLSGISDADKNSFMSVIHGIGPNERSGSHSAHAWLYLNFRRVAGTLIVMLSVPFALVGGLWLMWWLGFNFSVAVAVGFIALAGVAAEDRCRHVDLSRCSDDGTAHSMRNRAPAIYPRRHLMAGAVERVRSKVMTVAAITVQSSIRQNCY